MLQHVTIFDCDDFVDDFVQLHGFEKLARLKHLCKRHGKFAKDNSRPKVRDSVRPMPAFLEIKVTMPIVMGKSVRSKQMKIWELLLLLWVEPFSKLLLMAWDSVMALEMTQN